MWILALILVSFHGMRASLGQAGSPWNTGSDEDYYYEQLHPEDDLPTITTDDQKFDVNLGDPLVLPCPINNLGHFTLIWRRGGQILWVLQDKGDGPFVQPVSRDPRVSRNGTSLTILEVSSDDENTYTCEVSTKPPRSVSHTLTVKVPPTVYPGNNRTIVTIKNGATAYLRCIVSGNPTPVVTWTKEGKLSIPFGEGVNLTLSNAGAEDNGVYKCTADNGAGSPVHASINLVVMHAPAVRVDKEEIYSGVAYDATLACYVFATPDPLVKWYRENGEPVDPMRLRIAFDANKRYSLQFHRVQQNDFGYYTCNASNYMGNASATVRLTGRPKPVKYFSPNNGDKDKSYTLVWEVESYAPVLTYNIAYRNETDAAEQWVNFTVPGTTSSSIYHSKSHTFTDLEPGASYYVLVSAKNEYGYSDVNETFIFTTLDPEKAAASDGSSETFGLTPREKRAQMVALVTVISLSSFFF